MRSKRFNGQFEQPELFVVKAQDLPLSDQALQSLMCAVLAKGKPFRFRARGWSMTPFIRDRDVITISPLQQGLPGVGEVIAFVRPEKGNLVVHRVVAQRSAAVLIQGDNGPGFEDELIPKDNLLGRVTQIERNGHPVRLGLGPERFVIAWLSRTKLLVPLQLRLAALRNRFS